MKHSDQRCLHRSSRYCLMKRAVLFSGDSPNISEELGSIKFRAKNEPVGFHCSRSFNVDAFVKSVHFKGISQHFWRFKVDHCVILIARKSLRGVLPASPRFVAIKGMDDFKTLNLFVEVNRAYVNIHRHFFICVNKLTNLTNMGSMNSHKRIKSLKVIFIFTSIEIFVSNVLIF